MRYLLDTCVLSETVRPRPSPAVVGWLGDQPETDLYLSSIALGELMKGVTRLAIDDRRRERLAEWIETDLRGRFADRLVPITVSVAMRWGAMAGEASRDGRTLPVIDSLLAATAVEHGLVVATRNVRAGAVAGGVAV